MGLGAMNSAILIGQWVIPSILILFGVVTFFHPLFQKEGEGFGKAATHFSVSHIITSLTLLALAGGVATGVVTYHEMLKTVASNDQIIEGLTKENVSLANNNKKLTKDYIEFMTLVDHSLQSTPNEPLKNYISERIDGSDSEATWLQCLKLNNKIDDSVPRKSLN